MCGTGNCPLHQFLNNNEDMQRSPFATPYFHRLLPAEIEVAKLQPYYDFPEGAGTESGAIFLPRPVGCDMPANLFLIDRPAGASMPTCLEKLKTFPTCIEPYRSQFSKSVECYRLRDRQKLPVGAKLAKGVTVARDPDLEIDLPPDIYLVTIERQDEAAIKSNPLVEILSGVDLGLGEGEYLYPGISVLRLKPYFLLPAGVTLKPGVSLPASIQLPPDLPVASGITVKRRPRGLIPPPGEELFYVTPEAVIPVGFRNSTVRKETLGLPPGYTLLGLPSHFSFPSEAELSECFEVIIFCEYDVNTLQFITSSILLKDYRRLGGGARSRSHSKPVSNRVRWTQSGDGCCTLRPSLSQRITGITHKASCW